MQNYTFSSKFTTKIDFRQAKTLKANKLSVVYIHGLYSDPWGAKPERVKEVCQELDLGFIRFELIGHGVDKENYEQADFHLWKAQVEEVIDGFTEGGVIMIGSSLGGWLSLLMALSRPEKVKAIMGLAAAPDFTKDRFIDGLSYEQKIKLDEQGKIEFVTKDFTYVITKKLLESGNEFLLLDKKLPIDCPVYLLQGMKDESVDWQKALKIAECIEGDDVTIKLLKNSNHRLNDVGDLAEIEASLRVIYNNINA